MADPVARAGKIRGYENLAARKTKESDRMASKETDKKPKLIIDNHDSASTTAISHLNADNVPRSPVKSNRELRYGSSSTGSTSSSPTGDPTALGQSPRSDTITPASPLSAASQPASSLPVARPATPQPAKTNVMKRLYNFFVAPIVNYLEKRRIAAQDKFEANLVKTALKLHVPKYKGNNPADDLSYTFTRRGYISAMSEIVEDKLAALKEQNNDADIVRLRRNIVSELTRPENMDKLSALITKTSGSISGGHPDVAAGAKSLFYHGNVRNERDKSEMTEMRGKIDSIITKEINKIRPPKEEATAQQLALAEKLARSAAPAGKPVAASATPASKPTRKRSATR